MTSVDFKFQIRVNVDGKTVTKENLFCDTYKEALDTIISIVDSEYDTKKNDSCRASINLVKVMYDECDNICDVFLYITVLEKLLRNERPIKRYYLNDDWYLCYKKYGNRLIEGVVTELIGGSRYIFKAFTHRPKGTAVFRKPEIVDRDKIVWQREGE